ncbi:MAG: FAD-dependent oxidoreductase [Patescibacteria group bacterium]|nr:FAD-dependent oxidoreductase [Patescibacteria group bacterium]
MYDLVIIGGGPAGVAAGVYAARKKLKIVLIAESFGGQSLVSDDVQNWIGTVSLSGFDLAKKLEDHLRAQEDIEIIDTDLVSKVEKIKPDVSGAAHFRVTTKGGKTFDTKTVLVASGSRRRKLGVPGEKKFEGKGVVYCSTCDAPIFKDKVVAVVGGGNSGLEAVVDLFPYASKIYLLHRRDELKGDPTTQEEVTSNPKTEVILNAETQEILGDKTVQGLRYKDKKTGEMKELDLGGVFVEVGSVPNGEIVKGLVDLNKFGEIIVNHKTQATSETGIWAAGDITDVLYKQNNISAGDAVKAVLNLYDYLRSIERKVSDTALAHEESALKT